MESSDPTPNWEWEREPMIGVQTLGQDNHQYTQSQNVESLRILNMIYDTIISWTYTYINVEIALWLRVKAVKNQRHQLHYVKRCKQAIDTQTGALLPPTHRASTMLYLEKSNPLDIVQ